MPFKTEYLTDGGVRTWTLTSAGATVSVDQSYTPTIYVGTDDRHDLADIEGLLVGHPLVEAVERETHRPGWRHEPAPMFRVEVSTLAGVDELARYVVQIVERASGCW